MLGECSPAESETIQAWRVASEANQKRFRDFEWLWNESRNLANKKEVDVDAAWERFTQLRKKGTSSNQGGKVISISLFKKYAPAIAAIFIMILGLTLVYKWMEKPATIDLPVEMLSLQTGDKTLTDTLPDGSIVTLNKNSRLIFPSQFSDSIRPVSLDGEAFFDVAANPAKPFQIEAGKLQVTVLGTSFNVINRPKVNRVVVETGRVEVGFREQKQILKPEQQITLRNEDSILTIKPVEDALYRYYRSQEFVCDNTPLVTLVESLRDAYGADIIIENKALGSLSITTTFKQEPLDNILDIVAQTLGIKIVKNGEQYILR